MTDRHDHGHDTAHVHTNAHAGNDQPHRPLSAGGKYRTIAIAPAPHEHKHDHGHCCTPAPVSLALLAAPEAVADGVRTPIRIMQMDCPTEEALIRKKLAGLPSVKGLEFNLMQ